MIGPTFEPAYRVINIDMLFVLLVLCFRGGVPQDHGGVFDLLRLRAMRIDSPYIFKLFS